MIEELTQEAVDANKGMFKRDGQFLIGDKDGKTYTATANKINTLVSNNNNSLDCNNNGL